VATPGKQTLVHQTYGVVGLTTSVYEEVVTRGKEKGVSDAQIVEEVITQGWLGVLNLTTAEKRFARTLVTTSRSLSRADCETLACARARGLTLLMEDRRGRNAARAHAILAKIDDEDYANAAIADIESTLAQEEVRRVRFSDLLQPGMRKVLVLGIVLAVFQQWCGINVIFNYAEEIFRAAGYDISSVLKNIAWTGSVNLAFTFVALGVVDRGGRRPLMLFGSAGLAIIYLTLGYCFHAGVHGDFVRNLVLAAIACYSMSLAPVTWVVISEIFPNRIRGAAMSVAVSALWIACFLLTYTFPILNKKLGSAGTFWLYGAICVAGFVFIKFKLPETKGKSLEQIERELVD